MHILSTSCVTTQRSDGTASEGQRFYWKVYPKSDNTYYILPRPELTNALPTPEAMNRLKEEQARGMAEKLNSQLQFKIKIETEAGDRMIRIVPEPLIEDILEICRTKDRHPFLQNRCKKELAWDARGIRPDIYLKIDECEAVALTNHLNALYRKPSISTQLCPALHQVEK